MSFLLDTNVVSELRKGKRTDQAVARWFAAVDGDDLYLSVLVVGEIRQGVERIKRRDPVSANRLDRWLTRLIANYAERILPLNLQIAEVWGSLNVPDPLPAVDGLMAATAIVHELTLVTRNTRDVVGTEVSLVNPFSRSI